jgi:hypothetical protein
VLLERYVHVLWIKLSFVLATVFTLSQDAVIRVYDKAGNMIETHEEAGQFKE